MIGLENVIIADGFPYSLTSEQSRYATMHLFYNLSIQPMHCINSYSYYTSMVARTTDTGYLLWEL